MPHIPLSPLPHLSAFRRISLATWRTARDPSVYGSVTLRVDALRDYLLAYRQATGRHLTLTHLVGKAVAGILDEVPDVNVLHRWGRLYHRGDNVVMFQVAMRDPDTGRVDLSIHALRDGHRKPLDAIIDEFEEGVARIRAARDPELERTRGLLKRLPTWLTGWMVEGMSFLMYTLNLDISPLGFPRSPFGAIAVTNVGSLGIEEAYVPLVPYTRAPVLVALGAMQRSPVVDEHGELGVGWTLKVMATFDHRVLDGAHASRMIEVLRRWLEDPVGSFGEIGG